MENISNTAAPIAPKIRRIFSFTVIFNLHNLDITFFIISDNFFYNIYGAFVEREKCDVLQHLFYFVITITHSDNSIIQVTRL